MQNLLIILVLLLFSSCYTIAGNKGNILSEKPKELIGSKWDYVGDAFPWPRQIELNRDGFILYELFSYDFISKGDWKYKSNNNSIQFIFKDNIKLWKRWLNNIKYSKLDGIVSVNVNIPMVEIKIIEKNNENKTIRYLSFFYWGLANREDVIKWRGFIYPEDKKATEKSKWESCLEDEEKIFDPRMYIYEK